MGPGATACAGVCHVPWTLRRPDAALRPAGGAHSRRCAAVPVPGFVEARRLSHPRPTWQDSYCCEGVSEASAAASLKRPCQAARQACQGGPMSDNAAMLAVNVVPARFPGWPELVLVP